LIRRARSRQPIQYAEIVAAVGEPPAWNNFRYALVAIALREKDGGRPPRTALVFNKVNREPGTARMPGSTFWELLAEQGHDVSDRRRAWESALRDVYEYWAC
jgi:hypothetical protein